MKGKNKIVIICKNMIVYIRKIYKFILISFSYKTNYFLIYQEQLESTTVRKYLRYQRVTLRKTSKNIMGKTPTKLFERHKRKLNR